MLFAFSSFLVSKIAKVFGVLILGTQGCIHSSQSEHVCWWPGNSRRLALILSSRVPLQWHHNERDRVSNHWGLDCFLNNFFRRRSKKTSEFRVTGLCEKFIGDQWIPVTKGQSWGKCFHLITSSCHLNIVATSSNCTRTTIYDIVLFTNKLRDTNIRSEECPKLSHF